MVQQLNERSWKSINVQNRYNSSGPLGLEDYNERSMSWFRRIIDNAGPREEKLKRYDMMDHDSVEITRALDIIAEDVSSVNGDNEDIFSIEYEDEFNVKKTLLKTIEQMKDQWKTRTGFGDEFYNHARDILKYGCKIFLIRPDGSLKELIQSRIVGYVIDHKDDTKISHYLYDDQKQYKNEEGDEIGHSKHVDGNKRSYVPIPVNDLLVLKVGSGPYGCSILEKVFSLWRRLQLLEDSIVIYRVVRAPERRVFYIDTGALPPAKANAYVNQVKLRMKQKQISRNGKLTTEFDPFSTGEDYYIPQTSEGRGSRIESLQGGAQTGEMDDVRWFAKKLAMALRIPVSMIDTHSDTRDAPMFNDARVGQIYQEEMRYMGYIKRLQGQIGNDLSDNFVKFCKEREIKLPPNTKLCINEAQNFAVYKEIELNQQLLNVYNSAQNIRPLAGRVSFEKYLNMDLEEIMDNETMKLREMGLDEDVIKDMPDHVKMNLVYGDGRLGADYGIEVEPGGFGGRRF